MVLVDRRLLEESNGELVLSAGFTGTSLVVDGNGSCHTLICLETCCTLMLTECQVIVWTIVGIKLVAIWMGCVGGLLLIECSHLLYSCVFSDLCNCCFP